MKHLEEAELVDLLDGSGSPAAAAHIEACSVCSAGLIAMRSTLNALATVNSEDQPQPSPLFWEHFSRRVNERIDSPRSHWSTWIRTPGFAGALTAAALVLLVASGARTLYSPHLAPPARSIVIPQPPPDNSEPADDADADPAWAVVRTAAEDFVYEDAEAAGIAPEAGAAERVVSDMSNEERAELARLLSLELKRGA
jgi:hypothetical protein